MSKTAKEFTPEELERIRAYRREKRREYWQKLPPEERKRKNSAWYKNFWGGMTPEERKAKRAEYDLHRAMNAAARAAAAAPDAE